MPDIASPKSSPSDTHKDKESEKKEAVIKKTPKQRQAFNPLPSATWRSEREKARQAAKAKPKFTGNSSE